MSIRERARILSFAVRWAGVLVLLAFMTGCPPKPPPAYPFVPMHEAIRRVNENNAGLDSAVGGVKASPVDATVRFREHEGAPARQFSFSGALAFRRPRNLVLQLREGLGNTVVMQAGSNDQEYWLWVKPEIDTLWWGTYPKPEPEAAPSTEPAFGVEGSGFGVQGSGAASTPATRPCASLPGREARTKDRTAELVGEPASARQNRSPYSLDEMPIRPDDLIEVLGLSMLPTDTTGPEGPVYRAEAERNVLIFLDYDEVGQGYIQKEYHLDRAKPYLVREIVFREVDGRVRMHAMLSNDGPVRGCDALAAHKIRIEWPSAESWLELRIRRIMLETEPLLPPENPRRQGVRAQREIRVNEEPGESPVALPGGAT